MDKSKHLRTGLVVEDINDHLITMEYLEWLKFVNWWASADKTIQGL